jgi:hypothetical protein
MLIALPITLVYYILLGLWWPTCVDDGIRIAVKTTAAAATFRSWEAEEEIELLRHCLALAKWVACFFFFLSLFYFFFLEVGMGIGWMERVGGGQDAVAR